MQCPGIFILPSFVHASSFFLLPVELKVTFSKRSSLTILFNFPVFVFFLILHTYCLSICLLVWFWSLLKCRASLVAQMVKNLPAMWETQVQSLSQEDPLKKGMATRSSILPLSMNRGTWWATVHGVVKS